MNKLTFLIPPYLQYKDYMNPTDVQKVIVKKDGKGYGNLVTDMPLGCLSLSSYLKQHVELETKLVDFNIEINERDSFDFDGYTSYFTEYFNQTDVYDDTDYFAISCLFSPSQSAMDDLAKVVKEKFPNATILAGGNIPSNMYKKLFEDGTAIDYMCYGEGELPMRNFLQAEDKEAYIAESNSWIDKKKASDASFQPSHDYIWDLDEIPLYDYDLCGDKYFENPAFIAYGGHSALEANFHILTSRGCPYHCVFCASNKVHGRDMRYYSIERVKKDLLYLQDVYKVDTLIFQDDHFMGDPKRALEILNFVADMGVKVVFQNSLALYALKRPFLEALKRAGVDRLVLAVESGSDRVLREVMKKPLKLSIVRRVVDDCREIGIYTYCNILIGLPGETKKDIQDSRDFLKTVGANWFGLLCAAPLLGSEMHEICLENDYLQEGWDGSDFRYAVVSTEDWDNHYIQNVTYEMNLELNFVHNSDYRLGNYEVALDGFKRVLTAKDDHAVAFYMGAKCLNKLGRHDEAKDFAKKAQDIYNSSEFWKNNMDKHQISPFEALEEAH